jgi:hypothetical protein
MSATISTEEARALLARLGPIAADVRGALAATRDFIRDLPTPSAGPSELSNLRAELEEAEESLATGLRYLTAQPENEDCTVAALEQQVAEEQRP